MKSYLQRMREAVNCKGIILGPIELFARNPFKKINWFFGIENRNKNKYAPNDGSDCGCIIIEFGVIGINFLSHHCRRQ